MTQSPLFFVWRRPGLSGTEATPDAPLRAPITWGSLVLRFAVLNLFAPVDGARVVHTVSSVLRERPALSKV